MSEGLEIRLVDSDGKPVAGADAGLSAARLSGDDDASAAWEFRHQAVSDSGGMVRLTKGRSELDYIALVAWHRDRKLVAIEPIAEQAGSGVITVEVLPASRISGRLACSRPDGEPFALRSSTVTLWRDEKLAMEFQPIGAAFHFDVPPGKYVIQARANGTHIAYQTFEVKAGERTVALPVTNLRPTDVALLEGKPAPDLGRTLAWKNSGALTLGDLRGKVILLDFWGYWCGSCVANKPKLFRLHDEHADDGLVILGIHIDADERIDSAEKLDEKLANTRRDLWNGRDIPYPVVMVSGEEVPHGEGVTDLARCRLAADYGVISYPTYVLIDRKGRVAGRFFPSKPDDMALLKKVLSEEL